MARKISLQSLMAIEKRWMEMDAKETDDEIKNIATEFGLTESQVDEIVLKYIYGDDDGDLGNTVLAFHHVG